MARRGGFYRRGEDDDWTVFPPASQPIRVKGGIRAQSTRGKFVEHWWAERWIAVLESFDIGGRLGRGRAYARQGQVLSIEIADGSVIARVQGSRSTPYEVTIAVKTLTADQWARIVDELRREAAFAAKLLAGEMPRDVELIFERAKVSLFPTRSRDLKTYCSCPDASNPCKHIAAVYYLLGEEFDRDPFLLFALRGMPRDRLLTLLAGGARSPQPGEEATPTTSGAAGERAVVRKRRAVTSHGGRDSVPGDQNAPGRSDGVQALTAPDFWNGGGIPVPAPADVRPPKQHADALRRLGKFPFWRGETPVLARLEPVYARASARAIEVLSSAPRSTVDNP